jgi:glycosyltransferase involved in cell wall biosynthesis
VLNQVCGDWVYYLLDNGSDDRTGEIIAEYAKRDERIKFRRRDSNSYHAIAELEAEVYALPSIDWYTCLDADDDFSPDFLYDMLRFADENNLDVAACRSDFIDDATGVSHNEFVLNHDIIIHGEQFGTLFPEYFRFFGSRWGKLIKSSLIEKINIGALYEYLKHTNVFYRSDTVTMLWYLRQSKRAGVLSKLLHNYRHHSGMVSKTDINARLEENPKMPEIYLDFLRAKVGSVSQENEQYIQEVFERSMRRTLANILPQENTVQSHIFAGSGDAEKVADRFEKLKRSRASQLNDE